MTEDLTRTELMKYLKVHPKQTAEEIAKGLNIRNVKKVRVMLSLCQKTGTVKAVPGENLRSKRWMLRFRTPKQMDAQYGKEEMAFVRTKWLHTNWMNLEVHGEDNRTGAERIREMLNVMDEYYETVQYLSPEIWVRMEPSPVPSLNDDTWTVMMYVYCDRRLLGSVTNVTTDDERITVWIGNLGLTHKVRDLENADREWRRMASDDVPFLMKKLEEKGFETRGV